MTVVLIVWAALTVPRTLSIVASHIWLYRRGEEFANRLRRKRRPVSIQATWNLLRETGAGVDLATIFGVKAYSLFALADSLKTRGRPIRAALVSILRSLWAFQGWTLTTVIVLEVGAYSSLPPGGAGVVAGIALGLLSVFACLLLLAEPVWARYVGGWAEYHGLTYDTRRELTDAHRGGRAIIQWTGAVVVTIITTSAFSVFLLNKTDWLGTPELPSDPIWEFLTGAIRAVAAIGGDFGVDSRNLGNVTFNVLLVGMFLAVAVSGFVTLSEAWLTPRKGQARKKSRGTD